MDWQAFAHEKLIRYADGAERLEPGDERQLVRLGNVAYAAGLALLMAGDEDAAAWLRRASEHWRRSWDVGGATESWGRPIGAIKASLLAGDDAALEQLSAWTLELGTATADSPIGRYAGCLALLAAGRGVEARHVAASLRNRQDFPRDVADALAAIADGDAEAYAAAVDSVVASFEERGEYLEDAPVADTALVLQLLAGRAGLRHTLPHSHVLPA